MARGRGSHAGWQRGISPRLRAKEVSLCPDCKGIEPLEFFLIQIFNHPPCTNTAGHIWAQTDEKAPGAAFHRQQSRAEMRVGSSRGLAA